MIYDWQNNNTAKQIQIKQWQSSSRWQRPLFFNRRASTTQIPNTGIGRLLKEQRKHANV